jgi:hypothetical protein
MNSYLNLMLEAESVKDRLERLFQSTLEVKEYDQSAELVRRDSNARRSAVGASGSGDCPTNGHSVPGRKIGTKRMIQRGLRSQSPWDRSPRQFRRG